MSNTTRDAVRHPDYSNAVTSTGEPADIAAIRAFAAAQPHPYDVVNLDHTFEGAFSVELVRQEDIFLASDFRIFRESAECTIVAGQCEDLLPSDDYEGEFNTVAEALEAIRSTNADIAAENNPE